MNQPEIVAALREAGASVAVISDVGRGVPDLLVGIGGANLLMEVKLPDGDLNANQAAWILNWLGYVDVVTCPEDALNVLRRRRHI